MLNRAPSSIHLRLGSALLVLLLGQPVRVRTRRGPRLRLRLPPKRNALGHADQAAKLPKSAQPALSCDTCHESHEKIPAPANIPKPTARMPPGPAGDYASGVHGLARKAATRAPGLRLMSRQRPRLLPPNRKPFAARVPDTCGMCHAEVAVEYRAAYTGRLWRKASPRRPVHGIARRTQRSSSTPTKASPVNAMHIRDTCGSCHGTSG